MAVNKLGYTTEMLQIEKIKKLEKDIEKHCKFLQEGKENLEVKEIKFTDNQTEIIINTSFLIDIKNKLKDIDLIFNKLKNLDMIIKFQEQYNKEKISQINNLIDDKISNKVFEEILINEFDNINEKVIKKVIQLLYNKGVFDDAINKDQVWEPYLNFNDDYLIKKYGKEIKIDKDIYYLSDLDYNTRKDIIEQLKINKYTDIVDMRHRMKLTEDEIKYIIF